MKNRSIIICESIYNGNTLKLARTMAVSLGCKYISAQKAMREDLSQYELIGFGSGIYFGRHHPALFEIVQKLDQNLQNVFIFSSRGAPILGKYHEGLKQALLKKKKNILGEFSVRGYDETGPWVIIRGGNVGKPDENDLKKAERFVKKNLTAYCMPDPYKKIRLKLPIKEACPNTYNLTHNGTSLSLKGDIVCINQTACLGCGKCVRACPVSVIELVENKAVPVNELYCTLCRLCINSCSQRAINLHYTWRDAIKVAKKHSHRISL